MSRKSLLAVLPVSPWPARQNGVAIRYYPVLEALSARYDIDLVVLRESAAALGTDPLAARLRSVAAYDLDVRRSSFTEKLKTLARVLSPWHSPYVESSHHTDAAFELVDAAIRQRRHDTVLWASGYCQDAFHRICRIHRGEARMVHDCIDSGLLHYRRTHRDPGLLRRLDMAKMRFREKRLRDRVDEVIYISPADARAAGDNRAIVIPNGVLSGDFIDGAPIEGSIGFLGAMDYPPNVEAVQVLHEEVFKPLKRRHPDLRLHIIGRSPVESVRRLAAPDVVVTGAVDNIWSEISKVSVFVFPMVSGAGLQNKILESMYAARPVVTTQICNDSLEAEHGRHIFCGRGSAELVEAADRLLNDAALRQAVGAQARDFVMQKFALPAVIDAFERALFPAR